MKPFLFNQPLLPEGFRFPREYEELVNSACWPDIEPWLFMAGSMGLSLSYYGSMLNKFSTAPLIPFAMVDDQSGLFNDGWVVLACFDGADLTGEPRVRIYDYQTPKNTPWDNFSYASFREWFEAAQKESLGFKAMKAEADRDD